MTVVMRTITASPSGGNSPIIPPPSKVLSGTIYGGDVKIIGTLDPKDYLHDPAYDQYRANLISAKADKIPG